MRLIVEENGKAICYEVDEDEVTVGRDLEDTIPIRDVAASPNHIRIVADDAFGDGVEVVADDGVLLNGEPLSGPETLQAGDCLQVGATRIWYEKRGVVADEPEAPPASGALAEAHAAEPGPAEAATADDCSNARYTLACTKGPREGEHIALTRLPFHIGRRRNNELIIPGGDVSGLHCQIEERKVGGGAVLVDKGSTNGSFVNHRRVSRAVLADGAVIVLGDTELVFHDREAAQPGDGAPRASGRPRRPRGKRKQRVPPPGKELVAGASQNEKPTGRNPLQVSASEPKPSPQKTTRSSRRRVSEAEPRSPEHESGLVGAVTDLGAAAEAGAKRGLRTAIGAGGALVLLGLSIVIAGLVFAHSLSQRTAAGGRDSDPASETNGLAAANWSFEDGTANNLPKSWTFVGKGRGQVVGAPAPVAGGQWALRMADSRLLSTARLPVGGRQVEVRAQVRAGTGAQVALGVRWGSSTDPTLVLTTLQPVDVRPGVWQPVGLALEPPPGVDQAQVQIEAVGTISVDRVVFAERGLLEPRRRHVTANGLRVRIAHAGDLVIERQGRSIVDRLSAGLIDPSQEAGEPVGGVWTAAPAAQGGGWRLAAPMLAATKGTSGKLHAHLGVGKGGVTVKWQAVPDRAIALSVYSVQRASAHKIGAVLKDGEVLETLRPSATHSVVREVVIHLEGATTVLQFGQLVDVQLLRGQHFVELRIVGASGQGLDLVLQKSTRQADAELQRRFADATELERSQQLQAARMAFDALVSDARINAKLQRLAEQRARAIEARAVAALAEVERLEEDLRLVGASELVTVAQERCRFVLAAFPGSSYAARAQVALDRLASALTRFEEGQRAEVAEGLVTQARTYIDARQSRLARALLGEVIRGYADVEAAVDRAKVLLASLENAQEEGR